MSAPQDAPAVALDGESTGTAADAELVARLRTAVAGELSQELGPGRLLSPSADDEARVWASIAGHLAEANRQRVHAGSAPLDAEEQQRIGQALFDALLRLGPLERYLAQDDLEELMVNGHQRAFVVRTGGRKEQIPIGFSGEAELRAFASRSVAAAGRRLDEANPAADARLPDGSRLHVIRPPLAPFTCVTVRRHRLLAHSVNDLVQLGTLTPPLAELLSSVVLAGLNVVTSGGTAAGKTTALNAIAAAIPTSERVVTIEEAQVRYTTSKAAVVRRVIRQSPTLRWLCSVIGVPCLLFVAVHCAGSASHQGPAESRC
ncbi:MAG TPA: ATPase, T2SS/T4P/T4SS family [Actinomycetes bacterium]|nr:ATPase, T2SS/T4P/T4SS family [Actinomycetes bacterium]